MVKLTVLLVQSAETEEDVLPAKQKIRVTDATVNDELKQYIAQQAQDETGRMSNGQRSLTARMDPGLTPNGFAQAQDSLTAVLDALVAPPASPRKLAFFSAPNKSCVMTAFMMSCADVARADRAVLTWRLTHFEAASAPAALPVIVADGLCNSDPDVVALGGATAAVNAGIFHCAAREFNDGRTKCPMMKVFKKIKEGTQKRIDAWDDALDESGKKIHTINHVQYFRIPNALDPWSLVHMVPKLNLMIDFIEPKKFMLTPRQGMFDPKKHYHEWQHGVEPALRQTVVWARQAGCDTVIIIVSAFCLQNFCRTIRANVSSLSPSCLVSCVAELDDTANPADSLRWSFYRHATLAQYRTPQGRSCVPPFTGRVTELLSPHPGQDPAAAPQNRWAAFPDPPPEQIPNNYPTLPPFSLCLEHDLPPVSKLQRHVETQRQQTFGDTPKQESAAAPSRDNKKVSSKDAKKPKAKAPARKK